MQKVTNVKLKWILPKYFEQESIPVGCILPALKLYMFQFWLPPLDVTLGVGVGWSFNEQVWTSLQVSPPDVTSTGWVCRGGGKYVLGVAPATWPIPWCMWCTYPTLVDKIADTCEYITFPQLLWRVVMIEFHHLVFSTPGNLSLAGGNDRIYTI